MNISGLSLFENFLTTDEHDALVAAIDAGEWSAALRRRTQHFAWRYSYDRRPLSFEQDYLGELPGFLRGLANRVAPAFDGFAPDQAIVNEYLPASGGRPAQGISAHVDHVKNFGPVVVSVSLLSPADMVFERAGQRDTMRLEPRSLLVMEGDARYRWTHAIPSHSARRLSVTFRTVNIAP